jgi:AI-2 transport protein TqsA
MNLYLTLATRYGLNILGLLAVSIALYLGSSILIPFVISGLLAAILHRGAEWTKKRFGVSWFLACMSTIILLVVLCGAILIAVTASVPQIINRLPDTDEKWEQRYEDFAKRVAATMPFPTEGALPQKAANSNFYKSVKNLFGPEQLTSYVKAIGSNVLFYVSHTVLVLFITLFLMLEGEMLTRKVRNIFGTSTEGEKKVKDAIEQMAAAIRTYLLWRSLINLLLGLTVALAYKVLGLEQWYLWGVLTFVLNYVPYIGTIAAGVPPVLEALVSGETNVAVIIIIGYTLLVTFEGYWIVPRVMGKTMDLNATTVMITCLYWHLVWGIAGLFLAMPLMAAVKSILLHVEGWKPWGELLGSDESATASPTPSPEHPADLDKTLAIPNMTAETRTGNPGAEVHH